MKSKRPLDLKPSATRKLTDFFHAANVASSSPRAGVSSPSKSKASASSCPRPDQEVISVSTSIQSHISISSDSAISVPPPNPLPRQLRGRQHIAAPGRSARAGSEKRPHSPEIQVLGTYKKPSAATTVKRKKPRFVDDPDIEMLDSVIHIRRPGDPVRSKPPDVLTHSQPPRSSLPLAPRENIAHLPAKSPLPKKEIQQSLIIVNSDPEKVVPSSQSDEHELCIPVIERKDIEEVKAHVEKWRVEAAGTAGLSVPVAGDCSGPDVDFDTIPEADFESLPLGDALASSSEPVSAISSGSHLSGAKTEAERSDVFFSPSRSSPLTTHPTTPADSSPSTGILPDIPVPLSPKTKAAQIIAQIRAAAFSAPVSTPQPEAIIFCQAEDSSEEEEDSFAARFNAKGTAAASSTNPRAEHRYNLRRHQPTSSLSSLTSHSDHSSPPHRHLLDSSDVLPSRSRPRASSSKNADPLSLLLRERNLAEKKSHGLNSVSLAEGVVHSKDAFKSGIDDHGNNGLDDGGWDDEAAARRAAGEALNAWRSNSWSPSPGSDICMAEDEVGKLVGQKEAKAIGNILVKDRKGKQRAKEHAQDKVVGMCFWIDCFDAEGRTDLSNRNLVVESDCVVASLLQDAVARKDTTTANLLLTCGLMETLPSADRQALVPWLFHEAMSFHEGVFSIPSFRLLTRLLSPDVGISLKIFLEALLHLGVSQVVLDAIGKKMDSMKMDSIKPTLPVVQERRTFLVCRILTLIAAAARAKAISLEDAAGFILTLHLIGMDPLTPVEIRRDLILAIDLICNCLGPEGDIITPTESLICTTLLQLCSEMTPMNKVLFISFLSGGSGRTARIGRWVAHGLLSHQREVSQEGYAELPSLAPILSLFSPLENRALDSNPEVRIFDLQSKAGGIDYEDLGYHLHLLGVLLSSIAAYTASELSRPVPTAQTKERIPGFEKTPLEMIKLLLHAMYEKIDDRRGAHLDRSRTKAALQHLELRIEYQRAAAVDHARRKTNQREAFRAWFQPKGADGRVQIA